MLIKFNLNKIPIYVTFANLYFSEVINEKQESVELRITGREILYIKKEDQKT